MAIYNEPILNGPILNGPLNNGPILKAHIKWIFKRIILMGLRPIYNYSF